MGKLRILKKKKNKMLIAVKSAYGGKTKIFLILICNLLICNLIISQNITNTLGTSGIFTIKDNTNTYLSLSQSTGQVNILRTLRLEYTTSSSLGIIFKGADRFIHNYGTSNTFMGINSGNFTMTGTFNTALGTQSLSSNTTGINNTALGTISLITNTTGNSNTAVGYMSLFSNETGSFNTALGMQSLFSNTIGTSNTAVGMNSLSSNTTGYENTAVGYQSLYTNTISSFNTAVGYQSLFSNTDFYNTALGYQSLYTNNTGSGNTAVGYQSLYLNTSGAGNTAVGNLSLKSNTGNSNTALGNGSLLNNITGNNNTAVGLNSLVSNTGNNNTALGYIAGSSMTTGSNLTLLGYNAQPTSGTATNQITLGDPFVTSLRCNVSTITSLSDMRDKKNITDLSLGLDFLTKLKPRQFNWDKREWYDNSVSDGTKMQETPTAGFIAQELDEVQATENAEWLNLVLKDNPEKWEATPGNLLPIMVKAIQELKAENDELKQRLLNIEQAVNRIEKNDENISNK